MSAAINFKTRDGQQLTLEAVRYGDLEFVDAYRLCFSEDKKTLESIELPKGCTTTHICTKEGCYETK
jgi:hypothetical protein